MLADELLGFATGDGSWFELISAAAALIFGGVFLKMGKGIRKLGLKIAPKLTTAITGALAKLASKATTSITTVRNMFTTGSHEGALISEATEEAFTFSGGAITPSPSSTFGDDLDNWAEATYDVLREGDTEDLIRKITESSSGFTEEQIRTAIRSVFIDEHLIYGGLYGEYELARFDAQPEMASAFLRFMDGAPDATDFLLLHHEVVESTLFAANSEIPFRLAHFYSNAIADWHGVMKSLGLI